MKCSIEQSCIVVEKNYNTMKDKEKLEILLKVIQRIYDKNPEMQEVIDVSMIEVCTRGDRRIDDESMR